MTLPPARADAQVLVTGTSSGIGAEIARLLAERGYNLAFVARRLDRLEKLAEEFRTRYRVEVSVHARDLGNKEERRALIEELLAAPKTVIGVCNCAGFGTSGLFHELPKERELDEVELNVMALVEMTHAFVGPMVKRGEGAILNVASIASFQPLPNLATYGATKAFVQSFSEAIQTELGGTGVSCTVLCPGPVATEWADIANAQAVMIPGAVLQPQEVAAAAVDGFIDGKRSVVPGAVPKALAVTGRFAPRTVLLPAMKALPKIRRRLGR